IVAGVDTLVEIGPRATLLPMAAQCTNHHEVVLLPSLRTPLSETEAALEALGKWIVQGGVFNWKGLFPTGGRRVPLPTYPWQRQRYWIEAGESRGTPGRHNGHPLLGSRVFAVGADVIYETVLSIDHSAWLKDHRIDRQVVISASTVAEIT